MNATSSNTGWDACGGEHIPLTAALLPSAPANSRIGELVCMPRPYFWIRILSLYALPLIPLLEKMLVKIWEDQAVEVIVIAPSWPRKYHLLLQMACESPSWSHENFRYCISVTPNSVYKYFIGPMRPPRQIMYHIWVFLQNKISILP